MADFTLRAVSGVTVAPWTDPAQESPPKPSRVNPRIGFPHRRLMGTVGVQIEVHAIVGGVDAPLDAALGGRLFVGWFVQCPVPPAAPTSLPGHSSIQRFTPAFPGHYVLGVRRTDGGLEHLHVDASLP